MDGWLIKRKQDLIHSVQRHNKGFSIIDLIKMYFANLSFSCISFIFIQSYDNIRLSCIKRKTHMTKDSKYNSSKSSKLARMNHNKDVIISFAELCLF